jgi:CheY-like chemotaxis protein
MNSFSGPALEQNTAFGLMLVLAEDNPVNQTLTRSLLEQLGHRVLTVADGSQALEALKQQPVDVLLLDVMMPGLDGLSTLKALRRSETHTGARLPVLMLTGQAMDGDLERFTALGADGHVSKPVNRDKLDRAIKQLGLPAP